MAAGDGAQRQLIENGAGARGQSRRSRATGPQGWQDRLGAPARVPEDGPRILTPRNPET